MDLALAKMIKAAPFKERRQQLGAMRGEVERGSGKEDNAPRQSTVLKSTNVRIARVEHAEYVILIRLRWRYQPGQHICYKFQNEGESFCRQKIFVASPPYVYKDAALPPAVRTAAEQQITATEMNAEPSAHSSKNKLARNRMSAIWKFHQPLWFRPDPIALKAFLLSFRAAFSLALL
jgi:hypothetical protein